MKKFIILPIVLQGLCYFAYAIKSVDAGEYFDPLFATTKYYYEPDGANNHDIFDKFPYFTSVKIAANVGIIAINDLDLSKDDAYSGSATIINGGTISEPKYLLISAGHNFQNGVPPVHLTIYNHDGLCYVPGKSLPLNMFISKLRKSNKSITLTIKDLIKPQKRYFQAYVRDANSKPTIDYLVIRLTNTEGEKLIGGKHNLEFLPTLKDMVLFEDIDFNDPQYTFVQFGSEDDNPTYGYMKSTYNNFKVFSTNTRVEYIAPESADYARISGMYGDSGGGLYLCNDFSHNCKLIAIDAARSITDTEKGKIYTTVYSRINQKEFRFLVKTALNLTIADHESSPIY